jgi:membrane-bound lytic murein transglycosylase D
MKILFKSFLAAVSFMLLFSSALKAHTVSFAGEIIPVDDDFVANKLMNVIRKQIPNVNLPSLRARALQYFPYVEAQLKKAGIPADFKYLPIVESGFLNLSSRVGARGFWQIMPETGKGLGLIVSGTLDERDDIQKSTSAACKLLAQYYSMIYKKHQVASWSLTAAAYNFGIGNIFNAISKQGKNYFTMNLNPETAIYVYKIIAVKELFEYPELYMRNFGYNVFSTKNATKTSKGGGDDDNDFKKMDVNVSSKKGKSLVKEVKATFVAAHIDGKYKKFDDGDLITIELDEDLSVRGGFTRKGAVIKGRGWVIDEKVYVDLGYGHALTLYDFNGKKGLGTSQLRKGEPVLLKNEIYDDNSNWNNN